VPLNLSSSPINSNTEMLIMLRTIDKVKPNNKVETLVRDVVFLG
jgi:hypothetical protein